MLIFNLLAILTLFIVSLNVYTIKKFIPLKSAYFLLIISFTSWLINPTINYIYEGKFKHSGSPYAFLVAKYAENGVLATYLKEKCVPIINTNHQIDEGTYFLKNLKSNLFLDVEGYSMDAGAKIHQWEYTGADNQKFKIEKGNQHFVKISSVKSGKYVTAYTNTDGKFALKQDNQINSNSQLFEIKYEKESQTVTLKPNGSNVYLGSDTLNKNLGIQFIEGNTPNASYCRFQLISAANCFCYFKDSIPTSAMTFLWDGKSILSRTGNWANHEKEYKYVMHDILFSAHYFWKNLQAALNATKIQLGRNNIGDGIAKYDTTSSPYYAIKTNLPELKTKFLESRQNRGELQFVFLNYVNGYIMKISFFALIVIIGVPFFRKRLNTEIIVFTMFSLALICINAFVTGALANILDRLQSRISWIIPLVVILLINKIVDSFSLTTTAK